MAESWIWGCPDLTWLPERKRAGDSAMAATQKVVLTDFS